MPQLSTYAVGSPTSKQISRLAAAGARVIQPGHDSVVSDGVTDDRAAINVILDAHRGQRIVITEGQYVIGKDPTSVFGGLKPKDGTDLILHPEATLLGRSEGWAGQGVIHPIASTDIRISGGTIDGQRAGNPTGAMFGVYAQDCTNVHIFGMHIKNIPGDEVGGGFSGDGVQLRGSSGGAVGNSVSRCEIHNCVRQGVSVTRGDYNSIDFNNIYDIVGNNPGAGIDFEPDDGTQIVNHCTATGNFIRNVNHGVMGAGMNRGGFFNNQVKAWRTSGLVMAGTYAAQVHGNTFDQTALQESGTGVFYMHDSDNLSLIGNWFNGLITAAAQEFIVVDSCKLLQFIANHISDSNAIGLSIKSGGPGATRALMFKDNLFTDCCWTAGTSVVKIARGGGLSITNLDFSGNQIVNTGTVTNGVELSGILAADLLTWNLENNRVIGPTNPWTGFPTGYGPNNQVPTADLPAAAAAMDGKTLIEYVDSTHRSLVWYANGKRFKGASIAES